MNAAVFVAGLWVGAGIVGASWLYSLRKEKAWTTQLAEETAKEVWREFDERGADPAMDELKAMLDREMDE